MPTRSGRAWKRLHPGRLRGRHHPRRRAIPIFYSVMPATISFLARRATTIATAESTTTISTAGQAMTRSTVDPAPTTSWAAWGTIGWFVLAGNDTVDGQAGSDWLEVTFVGQIGTATASDSGPSGDIDALIVTNCDGVVVSPSDVRHGAETVNYSGFEEPPCGFNAPPTPRTSCEASGRRHRLRRPGALLLRTGLADRIRNLREARELSGRGRAGGREALPGGCRRDADGVEQRPDLHVHHSLRVPVLVSVRTSRS